MEDKIEMTPTNETTERPAAEIAPRAGLRVRADVRAGEAEDNDDPQGLAYPRWRK